MLRLRPSHLLPPLAVAALLVTTAPPAGGQVVAPCDAKHAISSNAYTSRVCDVPDYDQRRNAATLMGDGRVRPVIGLAGNGGCHCVPTSIIDLLGYYAQKGVDVKPGKYPWLLRTGYQAQLGVPPGSYLGGVPYADDEIAAYNQVGILQTFLGASVKTGDAGCGTSFGKVLEMHAFLTYVAGWFPHARFDLLTNGVNAQTPFELAWVQSIGATAAVAYGRYKNYNESGNVATASERKGGHAMAMEAIAGNVTQAQIEVRDPASDEANDSGNDRYRNSAFTLGKAPLVRRTLFMGGKTYTRWRWGAKAEAGKSQRMLDGWIALLPTLLVTTDGHNLGVHPGVALNNQDRPALIKSPFKFKKKVVAAAVLPSTGEIAVALQGSKRIYGVGIGNRKLRRIGVAPGRVRDIEADPTGRKIFALTGKRIVRMDGRGKIQEKLDLPRPADVLTWNTAPVDPAEERLVAVGRAGRRATTISPGALKVVDVQVLPKSALAGRGALEASFDPKGRMLLRRGANGRLRMTSARKRVATRTRSLRGARRSTGFALSGLGTILTIRRGRIVELTPGGTKVLTDSPFHGKRVKGRVLAITRSGGDLQGMDLDTVIDERIPWDPEFPEMARERPAPQPQPQPAPQPQPQPAPKANLVIDSRDDFGVVVRNAGQGDAGRFEVHVSRSAGGPDIHSVGGLAAGATVAIPFDCRREDRTLTVDATNAVDETSETDNSESWTSRCLR